MSLSAEDLDNLVDTMDINGDGEINFNEFLESFRMVDNKFANEDCSWSSLGDVIITWWRHCITPSLFLKVHRICRNLVNVLLKQLNRQ